MKAIILVRGAGDLATGLALRLHRAGITVILLERERPLVVRRQAAFAEAVFSRKVEIEGTRAELVEHWNEAQHFIEQGIIPVMVDPHCALLDEVQPLVIVDARMLKMDVPSLMDQALLLVGLGPGFEVGRNCHAVIETQRGHHLGRVLWSGQAAANTGIPGSINKYKKDRVLKSPTKGKLEPVANIGQQLTKGELIATVDEHDITAPFDGLLRGLIHPSVPLLEGMKIGDLDPRNDPSYTAQVSDKALAVGGGVIEAILSQSNIRNQLWND